MPLGRLNVWSREGRRAQAVHRAPPFWIPASTTLLNDTPADDCSVNNPQYSRTLERGEKCGEVGFLLPCEEEMEAPFIEVDDVHQCPRGAVVEVWSARREATQDRPFDLADVVEVAVDQGLPE